MEPNDYLSMESSMKGMSMILFTYYSSLCEAGFTHESALYLTQSWANKTLEMGNNAAKENNHER